MSGQIGTKRTEDMSGTVWTVDCTNIDSIIKGMVSKIKSLLPYDMARGGQVIEKLDLTFANHNRKNKFIYLCKF